MTSGNAAFEYASVNPDTLHPSECACHLNPSQVAILPFSIPPQTSTLMRWAFQYRTVAALHEERGRWRDGNECIRYRAGCSQEPSVGEAWQYIFQDGWYPSVRVGDDCRFTLCANVNVFASRRIVPDIGYLYSWLGRRFRPRCPGYPLFYWQVASRGPRKRSCPIPSNILHAH